MYWINTTTDPNDLLVCLDEVSKNSYPELTTGWVEVEPYDYVTLKATWNGTSIVYVSRPSTRN